MRNLTSKDSIFGNDEIKLFKETIQLLGEKFKIQPVWSTKIKGMEVFNPDLVDNIVGILLMNGNVRGFYLVFLKMYGRRMGWSDPSVSYKDYHAIALATLEKDFGRVLIRKKSIVDKVTNLILPVELKFKDDKTFNKRFYVVVNDKDKAHSCMTPGFRSIVRELNKDNYIINIVNRTLIIECFENINPQQIVKLAEFADKLSLL